MMIYSLHSVELYFESFFLLQIKDDRVVRRLFEEVINIFILFYFHNSHVYKLQFSVTYQSAL